MSVLVVLETLCLLSVGLLLWLLFVCDLERSGDFQISGLFLEGSVKRLESWSQDNFRNLSFMG